MSDVLDFDLTVKEVSVNLKGKDGKIKEYLLREATGEASARYRSAQAGCADLQDGKPVRIKGIGGLEPLLVSLCLFEVQKDPEGVIRGLKPVPEQTVRSWPQRVQAALFRKAVEISELEERGEDEAKKMVDVLHGWIEEHPGGQPVPTVEQLVKWMEVRDRGALGNGPSSSTDGSP